MTDFQKRNLFSIVFTFLVWLIIALFFTFYTPKKEEYKTIQLTLENSVQPVKKIEKPAVEQKSEPKIIENKTVEKKSETKPESKTENLLVKKETPVQKTQTKAQQQKSSVSQSAKPKMAQQTFQKSTEELMAEQFSKKSVKKEFDWSAFENVEENTNSSQTEKNSKTVSSISNEQALFGTAGKQIQNDDEKTYSSSANKNVQKNVSSSTQNLLNEISSQTFSSTSANVKSQSSIDSTLDTSGKVVFVMNDKQTRLLLEPQTPEITLSANASATIDSTKNLRIEFTVLENGHVELNSIKISPASSITRIVQEEIIQSVLKWRFNSASTKATATFTHKILKI